MSDKDDDIRSILDLLNGKLGMQVVEWDELRVRIRAYGDRRATAAAEAVLRTLPLPSGAEAASPQWRVPAWVIANGNGDRWRKWGDFGPEWTANRNEALWFVRRSDAEALAKEDEDAWLIQSFVRVWEGGQRSPPTPPAEVGG